MSLDLKGNALAINYDSITCSQNAERVFRCISFPVAIKKQAERLAVAQDPPALSYLRPSDLTWPPQNGEPHSSVLGDLCDSTLIILCTPPLETEKSHFKTVQLQLAVYLSTPKIKTPALTVFVNKEQKKSSHILGLGFHFTTGDDRRPENDEKTVGRLPEDWFSHQLIPFELGFYWLQRYSQCRKGKTSLPCLILRALAKGDHFLRKQRPTRKSAHCMSC